MDLYRELGDRLGQANVLDRQALAGLNSGNHPGAARATHEALALFRELDNRRGMAIGVMRLGQIALATGDHQEAGEALRSAVDAYHGMADRSGEAEALNELGVLHRRTGDLDEAREHHLRALDLAQRISSHWDGACGWAGIGRCDLAAGRITAAVEHLETARPERRVRWCGSVSSLGLCRSSRVTRTVMVLSLGSVDGGRHA